MLFNKNRLELSDLQATWSVETHKMVVCHIDNLTGLLDMAELSRMIPRYMNFSTEKLYSLIGSTLENYKELHEALCHYTDKAIIEVNADVMALAFVFMRRIIDSHIIQQDADKISSENMDRSNNRLLEEFEKQESSEH